MPTVGQLHPAAVLIGPTGQVELGVVKELSGLLDVLLVVGALLGGLVGADLIVLLSGEAEGNVRLVGDLSGLKVLLSAGSVVVGVSDGGPEVKVRDGLEQAVELGGLGGGRGRHEGGGGGQGGGNDNGGSLHCRGESGKGIPISSRSFVLIHGSCHINM